MLTLVSDAVGPSEPHRVVKSPVDRLGVASPAMEPASRGRSEGMGRMFSVRLNLRFSSSELLWSRMVMVPPPRWSGSR